jgi:hypothetical protein
MEISASGMLIDHHSACSCKPRAPDKCHKGSNQACPGRHAHCIGPSSCSWRWGNGHLIHWCVREESEADFCFAKILQVMKCFPELPFGRSHEKRLASRGNVLLCSG